MPNAPILTTEQRRQLVRERAELRLAARDHDAPDLARQAAIDRAKEITRKLRDDMRQRTAVGFRRWRVRVLQGLLAGLVPDDGSGPAWLSDEERDELERRAVAMLDEWIALEDVPVLGPLLETGSDLLIVEPLARWAADEAQRIVNAGADATPRMVFAPAPVVPVRAPAFRRPAFKRRPVPPASIASVDGLEPLSDID